MVALTFCLREYDFQLSSFNISSKRKTRNLEQWFEACYLRTPRGSQNIPGVRGKIPVMVCFCLQNLHDKTISNLVSFATAYVSEKFTFVRCSLTRKFTTFNFSYVPCIIFVGIREIIYYRERGSRDGKVWETLT
jgi:hypothetical protein